MRVATIDPGMDATACVYDPDASVRSGLRWRFLDVPRASFGTNVERVDARALGDFLWRTAPDRVFVELVSVGQGWGKGSNVKLARAAGYCEAVPLALGFQVTGIVPQRWKRFHKITKPGEDENAKEISRQLALEKIPEIAEYLKRKKDHGRAEAALMALYGADCLAPILPPRE